MELCLEEMALDLPGEVARALVEVQAEVVEAVVGWGATALGRDLVATASALAVVLSCLIKSAHLVTI